MIALACLPAAGAVAQEQMRPRHKVSAAQLHAALAARFPVRLGLRGLVEMQVNAAGLLLLPQRNKLGLTLRSQLSGAPQASEGEVDVVFALRYEHADRTVRAHQLEILAVRWPELPARTLDAVQRILASMAREAVGEVVLHKFSERELATADNLGFEPDEFQVVEDGLLVLLRPKPLR
jgi:hypothetical protein